MRLGGRAALLGIACILAACEAPPIEPTPPDPAEPGPLVFDVTACADRPLDLHPVLLGHDLGPVDLTTVLAVRYEKRKCGADLEVLSECRLGAPMRYESQRIIYERKLAHPRAMMAWAPLDPLRFVLEFNREVPMTAIARRSGVMRVPSGTSVSRYTLLSQTACEGATHVMTEVELGALALKRERRVAATGDIDRCDAKRFRPVGCDAPIALNLQPIDRTEAAVTDGPLVNVQGVRIQATEVSARSYTACVRAGACAPAGLGPHCTYDALGLEDHPINCIRQQDAAHYCRWRQLRLPTADERLRLQADPAGGAFPWGALWPPPDGIGNFADQTAAARFPHWTAIDEYRDEYAATAPVRAFQAGKVHSVVGNVSEWTASVKAQAADVVGSNFGQGRSEALSAQARTRYMRQTRSRYIGVRCAQ